MRGSGPARTTVRLRGPGRGLIRSGRRALAGTPPRAPGHTPRCPQTRAADGGAGRTLRTVLAEGRWLAQRRSEHWLRLLLVLPSWQIVNRMGHIRIFVGQERYA